MPTLHEYGSLEGFDQKRRNALESLLYSDETFIYAIDVYDAFFMSKKRASKLVLTTQRVIHFKKGFIKESSKDFSLEDIASIEYDKGYVMRKVTLEGQGISNDYQTLDNFGRKFVTAVREQMQRHAEGREPIENPASDSGAAADSGTSEGSSGAGSVPNKYGSLKMHILIGVLTIWWTLGIGNAVYAGYSYYKFQKATDEPESDQVAG